jgi:hypothetical protein
MQENKQDANRTNIFYQEQIEVEIPSDTQGATIGKLVVYQFMGDKPTNQNTSQESHDGQEYLSCHEIEDIEQRFLK